MPSHSFENKEQVEMPHVEAFRVRLRELRALSRSTFTKSTATVEKQELPPKIPVWHGFFLGS